MCTPPINSNLRTRGSSLPTRHSIDSPPCVHSSLNYNIVTPCMYALDRTPCMCSALPPCTSAILPTHPHRVHHACAPTRVHACMHSQACMQLCTRPPGRGLPCIPHHACNSPMHRSPCTCTRMHSPHASMRAPCMCTPPIAIYDIHLYNPIYHSPMHACMLAYTCTCTCTCVRSPPRTICSQPRIRRVIL